MKLSLSENIRALRKQKKMTQEKLAEALGVTVGAVYKWESGLSQPELGLIVEMADFFDTSVDALLGYKMKDNSLDSTLERLNRYCRTLDAAALAEAEKTLGKYPHSFRAVYNCADVYLAFGASNRDERMLRRALELLERSIILLTQNDDPRINEATINGDISAIWFLLGERERGLEILKRNNTGCIYSSDIGTCLAAFMDRPEEAAPYLSDALLGGMSNRLTATVGYVFVFRSRNDWESALDIVVWGLGILTGLKTETNSDALDKAHAEMLALLAYVQSKVGKREEALASLAKAGEIARRFDSKPDYSLQTMRFGDHTDQTVVFDVFGAAAAKSVERLLGLLGDRALSEQWGEMTSDGK